MFIYINKVIYNRLVESVFICWYTLVICNYTCNAAKLCDNQNNYNNEN